MECISFAMFCFDFQLNIWMGKESCTALRCLVVPFYYGSFEVCMLGFVFQYWFWYSYPKHRPWVGEFVHKLTLYFPLC